jgi:hypothetical protein
VDFLKGIGGKVVGGIVILGVVVAGIAFYQAGPEGRAAFFDASGKIMGWLLIVVLAPWALFWLVVKVAKRETNASAAALVVGITLAELLGLWWMFNFGIGGPITITFFLVGALLAAVYNLLVCDWIADKLVG